MTLSRCRKRTPDPRALWGPSHAGAYRYCLPRRPLAQSPARRRTRLALPATTVPSDAAACGLPGAAAGRARALVDGRGGGAAFSRALAVSTREGDDRSALADPVTPACALPLLQPGDAPSPPALRRAATARLRAALASLGSPRTGRESAVHSAAVAHDPPYIAPLVHENANHDGSDTGRAAFATAARSAARQVRLSRRLGIPSAMLGRVLRLVGGAGCRAVGVPLHHRKHARSSVNQATIAPIHLATP